MKISTSRRYCARSMSRLSDLNAEAVELAAKIAKNFEGLGVWAQKLKLSEVASLRTGKLDSNAAVANGEYPFFTCAQETYRIDNYAFDTEAVLLGGNNAEGIFPLKYYNGKFNAYQRTYVIESRDKSILSTVICIMR